MKTQWYNRRWIGCSAVVAAIGVAAGFAQTSPSPVKNGSIQGTVVGSDGTSLSGARVYAGVKVTVGNVNAPPTLITKVANGVTASPGNTFTITNLPSGTYVLCAAIATPGWLDPCRSSANVPVINLAAGQNLTGQTVVMTKGAVVQVRINDGSKLLATPPGAIAHDVEVLALGSNHFYYYAPTVSTDSGGRTQELTLPFNATHTFIVRSQQFSLTDSTGAAVPTGGHTQPLQVSSSAAAPQFTFNVTGKLN